MYKITKVKISGFWGNLDVDANLDQSVNLFIGDNGTGKTTFMRLLHSVFSVDISSLHDLEFQRIIINLKASRKSRKIELEKISNEFEHVSLVYKIGTKKFEIPFTPAVLDVNRPYRVHSRLRAQIDSIKATLEDDVNLSFLSVHRGVAEYEDRDRHNKRRPLVDIHLGKLNQRFANYQWQLESQINNLSKQFQRDVLKLMLFEKSYDEIDLKTETKFDSNKSIVGLKQAFKELNAYSKEVRELMGKHVKQVSRAVESVNKYVRGDTERGLQLNDLTPLTLAKRTSKLVDLSATVTQEKNVILEPINQYMDLLTSFIKEKTFERSTDSDGGISVFKDSKTFPLRQLSSGEKQLVILFTEALLQRKSPCIFIADEPELSLHISWQRRIVNSILELNPNAQLIFATHSPEVIGPFRSNTISMNSIINQTKS